MAEAKPPRLGTAAAQADADAIEQRIPALIDKWSRGETSLREIYGYSADELYGISTQGYTLLMEGKLEAAKALFEGLVALDPKNDYYYRALGVIYHRSGDAERAIRQFGYAIRVQPNDLISYVNRAEIYMQQKNFPLAEQDLRHVVAAANETHPMVRKAQAMLRMIPSARRRVGAP
jgi:Flp pilus assembly protein TadD